MTILTKKQMSEEDIKLQYITPAILAKWDKSRITMETKITDGKICLNGNFVHRDKKSAKYADYVLYYNSSFPIAIVEAKDNKHSVSFGLQQAITYAQMMDVPFVYSSNGDAFYEHDMLSGMEREIALSDFPSPDELMERYKAEANGGNGLSVNELTAMSQPYYSSQNTYEPRYYQRVAINRTVDAVARGDNRLLLVMATGTGKTYTAFQIVFRLLKSGMKRKILYLADRNILVDQSIAQDFSPLEKVIHKINVSKDDKTTITSHQVYFSLYQQLVGDDDKEHFSELFDKDFFDLIIVDECHRGSAKEDSRWRRILEYFSSATQIGMTATPKETTYTSNITYFGEPVYTYSLKNGIEDGFLAPFKVISITTDISDGWRPLKGQRDYYGNEIEDRIYNNTDYDYNIIIADRINQVALEITNYLISTDRMQKTIVFCATEDAAERMRVALVNFNADMVAKNPDYIVRITGSDVYGKSKLKQFISVGEKYPVIATTSKLLSTGADCKMTKLIVLDENIGSMTEFKQIIGRGTRLREKDGKTHFVVMDFRNISRLFYDPDWDGPIEVDPNYHPPKPKVGPDKPVDPPEPPSDPQEKPYVDVDGCTVRIINKVVSVYDADGKLLRHENIIDYTRTNILGEYADLQHFIRSWNSEEKKKTILELFKEHGIDLMALKESQGMGRADDYLGDDIPAPAQAVWEQFVSPDSTWEQFMFVVQRDYVFVEDGLSELAPVIGMDSDNILFEYEDADEFNENNCFLYFKKASTKKSKKLTLNAAFKQVFGDALEPLGFIKAKTRHPCFLRAVGDEIIHVINLSCSGNRISTASGVMTVYRPQIDLNDHKWDNKWLYSTEKFYSKNNVVSFDEKYWNENLKIEYTLDNEESLINALKKALEEVKKWVLPIFDDVKTVKDIIDYQHRLSVTAQYFAVCDNVYLNHEIPCSDGAILFALDDPYYYPKRVKELLQTQLDFEIEHEIHFFGKETYEETCERFEKNLAERIAQIEYVINNKHFYEQTLAEIERRKTANTKILNSYGLILGVNKNTR